MAMFALNMMREFLWNWHCIIQFYEDMAIKFFRALSLHCRSYGKSWRRKNGLWNEEDGFFYDVLGNQATEREFL